jgi:predicted ribonuclease YlaK
LKYKVLDTSCILYNWNVIKAYPKESIIIPYQVLQDLDKFKVSPGETGINAREACNFICTHMNSGS